MALQFTSNIASLSVEAGEAVAFEYQLRDTDGSFRDLTRRAFRLTLYNTADRTSYYSQDGQIGTDGNGDHFIQWVSDGSLTENLLGKANIYFEIAERLNNGKNVLSEGTVAVKQSAPGVPSLTDAPIARYVWRIVRTCDGTGASTPTYSKTRVELVLVGSGPTLKALALSTTMFTAAGGFTAAIQNATSGSMITAVSSDGTSLQVSGTTLSGTFANAGSPTVTLIEKLDEAVNSPRTTAIGVTVAAPAPTLNVLGLSSTSFVANTSATVTITGKTAGSTVSATSSDGTALTVSGSTLSGTFQNTGTITMTLVETLAGATNSPRISGVQANVSADAALPSNPNLNSEATVYGDPGTVFPLSIHLAQPQANYTLAVPQGLPVATEQTTTSIVPVSSTWTTDASGAASYAPTGGAVDPTLTLNTHGSPGTRNGFVLCNHGQYVDTNALGLSFPSTNDDNTTQTPPSIRIGFTGSVVDDGTLLCELYDYNVGRLKLSPTWMGNYFQAVIERNGDQEAFYNDDYDQRKLGTVQTYEVEWVDNPGGAGGTLTFYVDGVQAGASKTTTLKPRITPNMGISCSASLGNDGGTPDGVEVHALSVSYGKLTPTSSYVPMASGTVTADQLATLVIDARTVGSAQASKALTYTDPHGTTETLNVVIGEMTVPAGQAYKVVLEDWSTGSAAAHPNELVMTKPAAQNVRFEDATLYAQQPAWTELLPRGPVPTINGISYYCEGIRIGAYTTLQFGYDWSPDYMPSVPFGDPTADGGKNTYMVPHKWKIYDSAGTLLGTVEKPNGQPLNGTDTKPIWEGEYDGRNVAKITDANPHYPHGTVRSGVLWRSSDPAAYSQAEVYNQMPVYDFRVPFAMQTGYSVNGFDLRVFSGGAGGDGQANGFGNYRWMSWEPTTYQGIQDQVAATLNPYKVGATAIGTTPSGGIWLKYSPFNITGRGPISGPGGTRDDRQPMPEPVARYARDITVKRPHDNRPMKDIALSYLTGYVSDPVHTFENGRLTPLFKGQPRRAITMRNHYYGPGEGSTPPSSAFYIQGGHLSDWIAGQSPLKAKVPYAGKDAAHPYFGTFQIDDDHSELYPHWGSMLFKSPEFAMLGHRFMDQARMYANKIIQDSSGDCANRGPAWKYLHAALAWKTASAGSSRLYNRAEVLDFVVFDFEAAYDRWYNPATGYGAKNPPTNLLNGDGSINNDACVMAGMLRFGPCFSDAQGTYCHDFMSGYWLQSLHIAEKNGFNAALRAASAKAGELLDWLIGLHAKRIVGRVLDGSLLGAIEDTDYLTQYWSNDQITAAGGDVSKLPQTFAAVQAASTNKSASWDTFVASNGSTASRDGQAMDQFLGAPGLLKDMGVSIARLDDAFTTAEQRFQQKLTEETAKGAAGAGSGWFVYHQATCNRPYHPGS